MNAGFGAVAAARFFCLLFAFCTAGDLTLKGQAVLRESNSVSPFSFEADGEASCVGTGEAKKGSRSVGDITEISSFVVGADFQVSPAVILRDDFKVLSEDVVPFGSIGITAKF
jgi:hypothetical protein